MGGFTGPLIFGLVLCAAGVMTALPFLVRYVFTHCGANVLAAVTGMKLGLPGLFFKSRAGSIPLWSMLLWWPWLMLIYLRMRRFWGKHADLEGASLVGDGLYLGSYPTDESCIVSITDKGERVDVAVVDVTCELPRRAFRGGRYLNIPSWDGMAPTVDQIDAAVLFVKDMRSQGRPVLVHCAFGIGRSSTVMCAVLTAMGMCPNWEAAYAYLSSKRRVVRLNARYKHALREWSKANGLPPGAPRSPQPARSTESSPLIQTTIPYGDGSSANPVPSHVAKHLSAGRNASGGSLLSAPIGLGLERRTPHALSH
eukprot:Opistho-2@60763